MSNSEEYNVQERYNSLTYSNQIFQSVINYRNNPVHGFSDINF